MIESYLRNKLTINAKDLLNKNVTVILIFGENHYSIAILFYPFKFKAANESGK